MKRTDILDASRFDENGLYDLTLASGKRVKDDRNTIKKLLMRKQREFVYTKYNGEAVIFGADEENKGEFNISGRDPKSFKTFNSFDKAYDYWIDTYRKPWDK